MSCGLASRGMKATRPTSPAGVVSAMLVLVGSVKGSFCLGLSLFDDL